MYILWGDGAPKIMSDEMKVKYDKRMNSEGFIEGDWVLLYILQKKAPKTMQLKPSTIMISFE